jgi:prophage antirepressor-like protein
LFLEYRAEKRIIKNIKFKGEIIKINRDEEEWMVVDRVCRMLGDEKGGKERVKEFKYQKY